MTPKEKAKELVEAFAIIDLPPQYSHASIGMEAAKECALIAVNEILNCGHGWNKESSQFVKYWQQVKQEIENL